jgi:pyruvate/oxaloacetate carboxyltransferase
MLITWPIYDSFFNILIYEMWVGMTSLETKGRDIYKVFIRYYNEMFLERLRKTKILSRGDEQSSSDVISGPPNTKQVF